MIETVIREEPWGMTLDQIVTIGGRAQAHPQYAHSHVDEMIWRTSLADKGGPFSNEPPTLQLASLYFGWISKKLIAALTEHMKSSPDSDSSTSIKDFWDRHKDYQVLFRSRLFQDWCVSAGFSCDENGEYHSVSIREIESTALKNSTASGDDVGELGSRHLWETQIARLSKRFFLSDTGYLGLAPIRAHLKGEVWVLQGGDVPFILRRLDNGRHLLVGEAYVHGVMLGELVPDDERYPLENIFIQ
jgi:hypothetical protein